MRATCAQLSAVHIEPELAVAVAASLPAGSRCLTVAEGRYMFVLARAAITCSYLFRTRRCCRRSSGAHVVRCRCSSAVGGCLFDNGVLAVANCKQQPCSDWSIVYTAWGLRATANHFFCNSS